MEAIASREGGAHRSDGFLQGLGAGAEREVPDRRDQAVRAEHPDQPVAVHQVSRVGGVQPGEAVEDPVLVVGQHPAEVLTVADRGPVRRLDTASAARWARRRRWPARAAAAIEPSESSRSATQ